jgi:GR25 family glycosyltransferase involved in LPS biosynthesis
MENIDHIFIINLKKNFLKREKCLLQLNKNNISNYTFIHAINTINDNMTYNTMYNKIIENMDANFVKYNFTKGALGCLLSHIKCISFAKENNYKNVLILEDDFIMIDNFSEEIHTLFKNIDNKWDFIYLGKKQGDDSMGYHKYKYHKADFEHTLDINDYIYKPNYRTWATHSILIKNTMFDDIIEFSNNIDAPIDIKLMTLFDKYNFYCVKKDLFITDDAYSDIQENVKNKLNWGWNISVYKDIDIDTIENIFIYGFKKSDHTHHYIHKMYFDFFNYYYPNLNVYWYDENEEYDKNIIENAILFCSPCHIKYDKIPFSSSAFYIMHLDVFENNGYTSIQEFIDDEKNRLIINAQNYVILLCREQITNLKYFEKDIPSRQICLPWFANNFYNEIMEIKSHLDDIYTRNNSKNYLCYMGSIWSLNIEVIKNLIDICSKNNVDLLLKGRIFDVSLEDKRYIRNNSSKNITFVPFNYNNNGNNIDNSFKYIDDTYGVKGLLPLQGNTHNDNYISNRIFETISQGYLIITNNLLTKKYFTSAIFDEDIEQLIMKYLDILSNKEKWIQLMHEQIDEFLDKFYGYKNIDHVINFLREAHREKNNKLILFNEENKELKHKLWFTNIAAQNSYFSLIKDNDDIRCALKRGNKGNKGNNYNIYNAFIYDIFLLERLIASNYIVHIDEDYEDKDSIIKICNIHKKEYKIKKPLKIFCILSGQRTGSTMIIDVIQKTSKKIMALSEVFDYYDNKFAYITHHDIVNKNGILYNKNIQYNENDTISTYFKQFEDIASYMDYDAIVFKWTLDFNREINIHEKFYEILDFVSNTNIIYLDRNLLDCYISRKFAEKYGFSHNKYEGIEDNMFSIKELYLFNKTKEEYMSIIFEKIKNAKCIQYNNIIQNNDFIKNVYSIFYQIDNSLQEDIYNNIFPFKNFADVLPKQNLFEIDELLDNKYWTI